VAFAAWALFSYALATFLGTLFRRMVPAMAMTLIVYIVLAIATATSIRPHYAAPVTEPGWNRPASAGWVLSSWIDAPDGQRVYAAVRIGAGLTRISTATDSVVGSNAFIAAWPSSALSIRATPAKWYSAARVLVPGEHVVAVGEGVPHHRRVGPQLVKERRPLTDRPPLVRRVAQDRAAAVRGGAHLCSLGQSSGPRPRAASSRWAKKTRPVYSIGSSQAAK